MKFENIRNPIKKDMSEIELTEKELEYISMLVLEANQKKHKDVFSMSVAELNKLYRKFALPEFSDNRDLYLHTISLINNIAPYETLKKVYDKYNLKECKEKLEGIKNAPKEDDEQVKALKEFSVTFL